MKHIKIQTFCRGALLLTPLSLAVSGALADPVPGGTLDPTSIPKYVTPLVIPPVLYDDGGAPMDVQVALRQITQQVLPAGFPATPLWAYGNPTNPATFNNPAFTFEVTKDVDTTVTYINDLVDANGNYLKHIIQDENGNPLIDQTLHWAAPNQDCLHGEPRTDCAGASAEPYTGPIPMVTHVHGAHVGPGSDGYPEAWMLPNADNIDCVNLPSWDPDTDPDLTDNFACNGTFFESAEGADTTAALGQGRSIKMYTNDQPTATLWYHDHSLGITRLNVYAAGAGFWLIRDDNDGETGLLSGVLPGPAVKVGDDPNGDPSVRNAIREIPIAIQPKSFNADGTQYYPADRAFFEGLGTGQSRGNNAGVTIPFLPQGTSDISPVWNPEAFFNTMVVNGNTWPQLEVAPERYRLRFVNASDSRFLNLAMYRVRANGRLGLLQLPFYQIGSDQGLLPQVVRIQSGFATPLPGDGRDGCLPAATRLLERLANRPRLAAITRRALERHCVIQERGTFAEQGLLLGPAERPDVIVDFSGLPDGTVIRMVNTAPDAPFGGFPDVPADPATTGQVMQFVVNSGLATPGGDPSTKAESLLLDPNPGGVAKLGVPDVTRDLALLEEESADLCVEVNAITGAITLVEGSEPPLCAGGGEPFGPKAAVLGVNGSGGGEVQLWDDPISTNPKLGDIETWELWNQSADAHPIHLHLVKFEVVNRQEIGGDTRSPEPWEAGWKDTVIAYPGEVTRVKAKFDVPGLYVWHCHILSHEDNEMMVPYCVGTPGADCPIELF